MKTSPQIIEQCREWLAQADGLLITAGAGIGVDSGLPDFRGDEGFWQAYPAFSRSGIRFIEAANPDTFRRDARLAWGFYGHRLTIYRNTEPHTGFDILRQLGQSMKRGYFVFTSNVDGQFQKADFEEKRIHECHGSIHYMQCLDNCNKRIYSTEALYPQVNEENCQWLGELPLCPGCGGLLRPNILMFGDSEWNEARYAQQARQLYAWLDRVERPLVIELGAGSHVPTVRHFSRQFAWRLIRVNLRDPAVHSTENSIGIAAAARTFLHQLAGFDEEKKQSA